MWVSGGVLEGVDWDFFASYGREREGTYCDGGRLEEACWDVIIWGGSVCTPW